MPLGNQPILTFTSPGPAMALDLIWGNQFMPEGGTWAFCLDGGPPQTVTLPPSAMLPYRITLDGLDPAVRHTVQVVAQSDPFTCQLWGVATYPGETMGLGFARICAAGDAVRAWLPNHLQPAGRIGLLAGPTASDPATFGFPTGASLAIIALGENDCALQTDLAAYRAGLETMVQSFRQAVPNASIVLLASSLSSNVTDPSSTLGAHLADYPSYLAQMAAVAHSHTCAFVNVHARWGEDGTALGFQTPRNPHPTDLGHQDIAQAVLGLLGGTPVAT